jgi:hypothetical protein
MIYSGKKTTTPGTPVPLAGQIRAAWVIIQWKQGNSGNLYIAGPTTPTPFSSNVPAVGAGNSETLPFMGSPGSYSLDKILVDSDNAGDVLFTYGKP